MHLIGNVVNLYLCLNSLFVNSDNQHNLINHCQLNRHWKTLKVTIRCDKRLQILMLINFNFTKHCVSWYLKIPAAENDKIFSI